MAQRTESNSGRRDRNSRAEIGMWGGVGGGVVWPWREHRFGRYVCEKASIAVDGISLTVAGCAEAGSRFWVAVIPHTWTATSLQHLCQGDVVNLEADLMAKYAERLLQGSPQSERGSKAMATDLSTDWLSSHGWS